MAGELETRSRARVSPISFSRRVIARTQRVALARDRQIEVDEWRAGGHSEVDHIERVTEDPSDSHFSRVLRKCIEWRTMPIQRVRLHENPAVAPAPKPGRNSFVAHDDFTADPDDPIHLGQCPAKLPECVDSPE